MEAVFLRLLNMSITAGWLVLAVIILRLVLKKAPKFIHCILWVFVGIRLVIPFTFESAWSLIPSAQTISPDILDTRTPRIHSGISFVNQAVNPVISESLSPTPVASINPMQTVTNIAMAVWMVGMMAMLAYSVISYVLLRRRVAEAVPLRDNLWQSEAVSSPFVLGLLRPRIYVPFSMKEEVAAHVIAHEQAHISRRDHWIKPLGFLLLSIYWFNPLMWAAYVLLCRDIELACDEHVAKGLSVRERKSYSMALLSCGVKHRAVSACPLAFGEVGVKQRVKSVLNYKKPAFWIIMAAVISCMAVVVCFLTNPKSYDDPARVVDEDDINRLGGTFVGSGNPYTSKRCVFINPLSSYYPVNGDSGYWYLMSGDSFAIVNKKTGETVQSFTDVQWNWQELSRKRWQEMFPIAILVPDISAIEKPLILELSSRHLLFNMDGELWAGEYGSDKTGMWSIYELTPGENAPVIWEYTPLLSSRYPAFPFHFDLEYTRIEAECSTGTLIGYDDHDGTSYPMGQTLTIPEGSRLYWSPWDEHSSDSTLSSITFTVYDGDQVLHTGILSITSTNGTNELGGTVYTAVLLDCNGLYMGQADTFEGATLTEVSSDI